MEPDMWGITDLLRRNYFNSEQTVRVAVRKRRWPKPVHIGGRALWKRTTVEAWIANRSICWIPRTGGQP